MKGTDPISILTKKIADAALWEKELTLSRGDYLKLEEKTDTNLYWVSSGSLRIYVIDEEEELTIRFAYQNNFVAALDSFLSEGPSDLVIQALKRTELRVISKIALMEFLDASVENSKMWQQILEGLILQQLERERDILISSPQERYRRVFKRSPQLFQEVPHKYIASYLRMTPETLSRIKKS